MGFIDNIKDGIKGHFDKRKEDREFIEKLELEKAVQKRIIFEEEYKKNALEVVKSEAKKEAAEKSGLQKLRAINRSRRLNEPDTQDGSFFGKLSEYTHKNIARREQNLKRTEELREAAIKMREERTADQKRLREQRMFNTQKPFKKW